jgi:CheY-like chemotaxis protein
MSSIAPRRDQLRDLRGVVALVVGDQVGTRQTLEHALAHAGAVVLVAASGREALRLAQHVLPSVIVTDLVMPDGDGFWLMAQLGKLSGEHAVPVIGLSDEVLTQGQADWKAAGFKAVVMKPIDPSDFCEFVSDILARMTPPGRRARAAIFKIGDAVIGPSRPEWIGEVVDVSRLGNGYVTVRWRTPSGTSLQSMEERVHSLVVLPPLMGGGRAGATPAAILALNRSGTGTQRTSSRVSA